MASTMEFPGAYPPTMEDSGPRTNTPPPEDATFVASTPPPIYLHAQRLREHHREGANDTNGNNPNNLNTTNNNNHDNNGNNLQMERVTFHLHSRLCNFGLTHTSYRTRKIFEHMLLIVAICCACALLMLHRTFVVSAVAAASGGAAAAGATTPTPQAGSTCLDALEGFDPALADITHLVILPHNLTIGNSKGAPLVEPKSTVVWTKATRKKGRIDARRERQSECSAALGTNNNGPDLSNDGIPEYPLSTSCSIDATAAAAAVTPTITTAIDKDPETLYYREWLEQQLASNTLPISYSYSTTKAYLMLPYDHFWLQHDMDIQYVLVAPTDPVCFGEPFVQFLLWNCFIGGNTVLLNWLAAFPVHDDRVTSTQQQQQDHHESKPSKGYVYNPRTGWLREFGGDHQATAATAQKERLSSRWNKLLAKIGVFLRTSFLFFFCTTLVSFTLRETQERMLDFTRELSRRVRQSISLSDLITTHLVQNLVFVPIMLGMMFFLIEFYHGDKFLAFSITSIVWAVEVFSLICLRCSQGLQYFPYFFFLLFLLFHVYQTAFPDHGFVYLALTVVWSFMLHSMVFFWHRYELPALVLGVVSVHRPRMVGAVLHGEFDNEYTDTINNNSEHNNNPTNNREYSSNGIGRNSEPVTMATDHRREQEQFAQPDEASSSRLLRAMHPANRTTTPILSTTETTTVTPTATTTVRPTATTTATIPIGARTSSPNLNTTGPGTGFLASRPSFQSTSSSSRLASGLYRHNQEDDSSTGSHLYFMGGEVVVHRRPTNSSNINISSNTNGQSSPHTHGSRELLPPTMRRGNSCENISAIGAPTAVTRTTETSTQEEAAAPISLFIRNESNFSLLSSASDAFGSGSINGASSSMGNPANNSSAIGLDVTRRYNGDLEDDLFGTTIHPSSSASLCNENVPNDTSFETVHASNVSTPQKQQQQQHTDGDDFAAAAAATTTTSTTSDGYYAEESGGLQAIFETKLTPRHRNTNQLKQHNSTLERGSISATTNQHQQSNLPPSSSGIHYQRRPPSFPELNPSN